MEIHGFDDIDLDINGGGNQLNEFLIDQFNRGIMYYNYRGFYFGEGSYPPNSNDLNNGYYTPFVSTITCGTGDFNGTSSSEGFVRMGSVNDPKGAVAAVGDYAVVTTTTQNKVYYKNSSGTWVKVGSAAWVSSWPTVTGTAANPTPPAAALTNTLWPAFISPLLCKAKSDVKYAINIPAAASKLISSGIL